MIFLLKILPISVELGIFCTPPHQNFQRKGKFSIVVAYKKYKIKINDLITQSNPSFR